LICGNYLFIGSKVLVYRNIALLPMLLLSVSIGLSDKCRALENHSLHQDLFEQGVTPTNKVGQMSSKMLREYISQKKSKFLPIWSLLLSGRRNFKHTNTFLPPQTRGSLPQQALPGRGYLISQLFQKNISSHEIVNN